MKSIAKIVFGLVCVVLLITGCAGKQTATQRQRGIQYFDDERYEEAKTEFEVLVAEEPVDPTAAAYLGRIALENNESDKAIERLEKAVALEETNADFHFWLAQAFVQKIQKVSFMERGTLAPKFTQALEKAIQLDPKHVDAKIYLASFYLNAPPIAGGSATKAGELAEEIKPLDPERGHQMAARVFMKKKDFDSAEKEYLALVDLKFHHADSYFELGRFYQEAKWWDKAFTAFEKALEVDETHLSSRYQIGRTAVFSGENLDRAVECLKIYLQHEPPQGAPTWANARWRLGMVYEKQGHKDLARKEYEEALKLDPNDEHAKKALENLK
jgi:tetratricopeptide (TPR) repeat protein